MIGMRMPLVHPIDVAAAGQRFNGQTPVVTRLHQIMVKRARTVVAAPNVIRGCIRGVSAAG